MKCKYCTGQRYLHRLTDQLIDSTENMLIIKNIPAYKCDNCKRITLSKNVISKICDTIPKIMNIKGDAVFWDYSDNDIWVYKDKS